MLAPPQDPEGETERRSTSSARSSGVHPATEIMLYVLHAAAAGAQRRAGRAHSSPRALRDCAGEPVAFPEHARTDGPSRAG